MTTTKQHILNTLAYFDIFHYPLLKEEIHRFHGESIDPASIDEAIITLTGENLIFRVDEFYALHNERTLAARRRRSFDGHAFCQVAWPVHVVAAGKRGMVGKQLQGDGGDDGREKRMSLGHDDYLVRKS